MTFPESLQTLTFGDDFDQSLTGVQLPESLRSLTFGGDFNQRLLGTKSLCCKGSALRTSEPTKASQRQMGISNTYYYLLDFIDTASLSHSIHLLLACFLGGGHKLNPWVAVFFFPGKVRFPDALENLTFGILFNQSLAEATLPSKLQRLALGDAFNQRMAQVKLPNTLQYLALGDAFNQSLDSCYILLFCSMCLNYLSFKCTLKIVSFVSNSQMRTCSNILVVSCCTLGFDIYTATAVHSGTNPRRTYLLWCCPAVCTR